MENIWMTTLLEIFVKKFSIWNIGRVSTLDETKPGPGNNEVL